MNAPILAAFCGIITAFSWGLADFFAASATKERSAETTAVAVSLIGGLAFTAFFFFSGGNIAWSRSGVEYGLGAGLFLGIGLMMFYRGLEIGPVSIVSPIGSAYPVVTTLVVALVLGGHLTMLQGLGILLVTGGIIAASGVFEVKPDERRIGRGFYYAVLTFVMWGIGFALLGQSVAVLGWQKATLIDIWTELIAIKLVIMALGHKVPLISTKVIKDKLILGAALIQLFGLIIFDYGLMLANSTAVITAISASYPALTVVLAFKKFGEKQTIIPLTGAIMTIAGIVVLSLH